MATARQATELRRWADLTVIHGAFQARLPELLPADSGLKDVAKLCKRDFAARPARDRNDVRDELVLVGVEWKQTAIDWTRSPTRACARLLTSCVKSKQRRGTTGSTRLSFARLGCAHRSGHGRSQIARLLFLSRGNSHGRAPESPVVGRVRRRVAQAMQAARPSSQDEI